MPPELLDLIKIWGPPGVFLALLLMGFVHTKTAYEDVKADRDAWKTAFEKERDGHSKTREAFAEEARRGDAAIEAAKLANGLLDRLGHRS